MEFFKKPFSVSEFVDLKTYIYAKIDVVPLTGRRGGGQGLGGMSR